MSIPSVEEFLARAKILKDQGISESEIVRQLNAELKKCPRRRQKTWNSYEFLWA